MASMESSPCASAAAWARRGFSRTSSDRQGLTTKGTKEHKGRKHVSRRSSQIGDNVNDGQRSQPPHYYGCAESPLCVGPGIARERLRGLSCSRAQENRVES